MPPHAYRPPRGGGGPFLAFVLLRTKSGGRGSPPSLETPPLRNRNDAQGDLLRKSLLA